MGPYRTVREVLLAFGDGRISADEAERSLNALVIEAVSDLARLDVGRGVRCGLPEIVLAEGKEPDDLAEIALRLAESAGRCIVSRVSEEQKKTIEARAAPLSLNYEYNDRARIIVLSREPPPTCGRGIIGILTAGTADIRVAEEARIVAEEMGCTVKTSYDVGVAGIHRVLTALKGMGDVDVFIVAAGREGTLPAIVAGLVDRPVIGVPVSTGYGYMGRGEAALGSMLQSCAVLGVVNIDAGVIAGAFAAQIARRGAK
ncbi:MAG: nickel pincer cofactor biosynthesis protein LarB [Methanomicrobiales archaeon]|nr:nickel pincer cofactor biosynthesis protein LarB [Methanomicrobiales archaeon]